MDRKDLDFLAEGAVILDDLDGAIIGVVEEFGNGPRVLYSRDKIIEILQERDEMTYEEALKCHRNGIDIRLRCNICLPIYMTYNRLQKMVEGKS